MGRAVVIALATLVVGCTTEAFDAALHDDTQPRPSEGSIGAGDPAAPLRAGARVGSRVGDAATAPLRFVCRKDAFCEDFEGVLPGSRWSGATQAVGGVIDFVTPSSSLGARSMRAQASTAGARAFLVLDGANLGARWSGAFGFSMRVDALPSASLGGPALVVATPGGDAILRVSVRADGIVFEQEAAGVARADVIGVPSAAQWTRVVVGVEASGEVVGPTGSTYGRIELGVDGADNLEVPLVVAPFGGKAELRAGITSPDAQPATLRVDDVMFFTR